jgi:hypothetical protein
MGPRSKPQWAHDAAAGAAGTAASNTQKAIPIMKTLAVLTLAVAAVLPAYAGTNIGVTIGINAPGQYGRINIDNYPQVQLVAPQPIIYAPSPVAAYQRPIYLYVPQAHQASWGRYCGRYGACGQPVYFVQENWVQQEYGREHDNRNGKKHFKRKDDKHHGKK